MNVSGKQLIPSLSNDRGIESTLIEAVLGGGHFSFVFADKNMKIQGCSKGSSAISGFSESECIGQDLLFLYADVNSSTFFSLLDKSLMASGSWEGEAFLKRKDGQVILEHVILQQVLVEKVLWHVLASKDMQSANGASDKIRDIQKQEALATLVGGVSHNFNNYLAAISGKAFMYGERPDLCPSALEDIQRMSTDAAALIGKLLVFSSRTMIREPEHAVQALVIAQAAFDAVHARAEDSASYIFDDEVGDSLWVYVVRADIEQVLINLLNNALDSLGNSAFPEVRLHIKKEDGCVVFSVHDTGSGINSAELSRVFEPFFTTKDEGTGLGLSVSAGIINDAGGRISVESAYGVGTVFEVFLPVWKI